MQLIANTCLGLSVLVYLVGLLVLVPAPVTRLACAHASLKVAALLIVSALWFLLSVVLSVSLDQGALDWMGVHRWLLHGLVPVMLLPLAVVTAASGIFFHSDNSNVPSCFRWWRSWAIIAIPALLMVMGGVSLHSLPNMRPVLGFLSLSVSAMALASAFCSIRYWVVLRFKRRSQPILSEIQNNLPLPAIPVRKPNPAKVHSAAELRHPVTP